jgi:cell wall-associated NlpC family hydrolase
VTTPTEPALHVGDTATVAVPVANGWRAPDSPRDVDAPAAAEPPETRRWLTGLDDDLRRGLVGRLDTQLLVGDDVVVMELREGWARVAAREQSTPDDDRGYPVWLPRAHLAAEPKPQGPGAAADDEAGAPAEARTATVVALTTWLEDDHGRQIAEVSFGTRLPVLAMEADRVQVAAPGGPSWWLPGSDAAVRAAGEPARSTTPEAVIQTARQFLGLPYLWAGTSGFGFDCSGLVYLVLRVHGVSLPRDTGPQSEATSPIEPAAARPGDLVFADRDGDVHHVAFWLGDGMLLESPRTGLPVRVVALDAVTWGSERLLWRRVIE